jgi:hypothetical protein
MSLAILFWVLYIVAIIFGAYLGYTPGQPYTFKTWGGSLLVFVLFGILGWAVFGAPVK